MALWNRQTVGRCQLALLPKQTIKCPAEIATLDPHRDVQGITTDTFLSQPWNAAAQHVMMNVVLLVKELETRDVKVFIFSKVLTKTSSQLLF